MLAPRVMALWAAVLATLGAVRALATKFALISDCGISGSHYSCSAVAGLRKLIARYPTDHFYDASTSDCPGWLAANSSTMDIIVSVGFQYADCLSVAAPSFPNIWFVSIDGCNENGKAKGNLICAMFIESLVSYAAGYVAGLASSTKVLGVLGGFPVDPVWRLVNGFSLGVAASCPDCRVIAAFVNSFYHPNNAVAVANYFINMSGVDVVAGFGGATGSAGILRAAQSGFWAVGVDVDEYLTTFAPPVPDDVAARLLTSAQKKMDNSVVLVAELLRGVPAGAAIPGVTNGNVHFDYANGGIGLAPCNLACSDPVADSAWKQVFIVEHKLAAGQIQVSLQPSGKMELPGARGANTFRPPATVRGFEPQPRMQHAMASFGTPWIPYVAVFGGVGSSGTLLGDLWLFNVGSLLWEMSDMGFTVGTPPAPRMKACLVGLGSTLLVFGGRDGSNAQSSTAFTFTLQPDYLGFSDPASPEIVHRWANLTINGAPVALEGAGCLAANSSCALIYGGRGRLSEQRELHRLCLDGLGTATWTTLWPRGGDAAGPSARDLPSVGLVAGASVGLVAETEVLIVAGGTVSGLPLADVWVFTLHAEAPTWRQLPDLPVAPQSQLTLFTEQAVGAAGATKLVLVAQLTSEEPDVGLGAFTLDTTTNAWSKQGGRVFTKNGTRLDGLAQAVGVRSNDRTWLFGGQLSRQLHGGLLAGPFMAAFDLQKSCSAGESAVGADCVACPAGKVSLGAVGAVCSQCPAGRAASAAGQSACYACPAGRFSDVGAVSCSACPAGRSTQMETGSEVCRPCSSGRFSGVAALYCDTCPIGTYSATLGLTECIPCEGALTTRYPGTESSELCGCTAGSYRPAPDLERDRCEPCPAGMRCDWGSDWRNLGMGLGSYPVAKLGYMTLASNPSRVFRCKLPASCPGGAPASCALRRDNASVACGECLRGSYDNGSPDGSCLECTRGAAAPAVVVLILASVVVISAVRLTQSSQLHEKSQMVFLGLLLVQFVSAVQTLGIFGNLDVEWASPLAEILHGFSVLTLDISVLRAGCIVGYSPLLAYLSRHVVLPVCVLLVFVGLAWKKHSMPDINLRVELCNSMGSVMNVVFISIVIACAAPLWCTIEHTCGVRSMLASPSILCWEDPQHVIMVVVGVLGFAAGPFLFISIYACVLFRCSAIVKNMSATAQNLRELQAARFIFVRFKPSAAWYGLVLLLRNLLIALVPVVMVDAVTQLSAVFTVVMIVASIQQNVKPWRLAIVNIVDGIASNFLLLILLAGSAGTAGTSAPTTGSRFAVWLGFVSCIILLSAIILPVAISFQSVTRRKMYSHFICYHKEEASAQARYLKLLLGNRRGTEVFIDADNLANIGSVFEVVRNHVRCVVVYMTSQTLTRPWCAGEIVSAFAVDLLVIGVRTASFVMPPEPSDLTALERFLDLGSCSLTEYGIILPMIAEAYQILLSGPDSRLIIFRSPCGKVRMRRFQELVEDLIQRTGPTYSRSVGILPLFKRGSPAAPPAQPDLKTSSVFAPVLLCSDGRDDEATAAAGVLAAKLHDELRTIVADGILMLADHDQDEDFIAGMVGVARALIVILSASSLTSMPQMVAITEAISMVAPHLLQTCGVVQSPCEQSEASTAIPQVLEVIPLSLPGFTFPLDSWFTETLPRVWAHIPLHAHHELRIFFRLTVSRLQTFGSDASLQAQAKEFVKRVPSTWKPRPMPVVDKLYKSDAESMAHGGACAADSEVDSGRRRPTPLRDGTVGDGADDSPEVQVTVMLQAATRSPLQLESL